MGGKRKSKEPVRPIALFIAGLIIGAFVLARIVFFTSLDLPAGKAGEVVHGSNIGEEASSSTVNWGSSGGDVSVECSLPYGNRFSDPPNKFRSLGADNLVSECMKRWSEGGGEYLYFPERYDEELCRSDSVCDGTMPCCNQCLELWRTVFCQDHSNTDPRGEELRDLCMGFQGYIGDDIPEDPDACYAIPVSELGGEKCRSFCYADVKFPNVGGTDRGALIGVSDDYVHRLYEEMEAGYDDPRAIEIHQGQYAITSSNAGRPVIQTPGIRTCTAVVLDDRRTQSGALAHFDAGRLVEDVLYQIVNQLEEGGSRREDIKVDLYGGLRTSIPTLQRILEWVTNEGLDIRTRFVHPLEYYGGGYVGIDISYDSRTGEVQLYDEGARLESSRPPRVDCEERMLDQIGG